MQGKILIVDDDPCMCEMLETDLGRHGFDPSWYTSADEALKKMAQEEFDAVLTDLRLPGVDGIELCKRIATNRPDVPVIVITGFGSMEAAVDALRAGAYDFVTKPIDTDFLVLVLARAVKHRALQEKVRILTKAVKHLQPFDELIGESAPMQKLYEDLARIADTETSVLITGETGTGKEIVARALHHHSRRREAPFIAFNCATLPDTLLESELFGHKRGAFTDAKCERKGLFIQADGGTLFFDEIADFPIALQPKLLRAIEENSIRPVGADTEVGFDVRIIAATNHDIESAVEEGRFRKDLFYRINVIQIKLPPLRVRGTDTLLLAQHFIKKFATLFDKQMIGISKPAAEALMGYKWPGNVRELRNIIERAVALSKYDKITVEDLPEKVRGFSNSHVLADILKPAQLVPMDEVERRYILFVLDATGGSKTLAARVLGMDRKTLYRKLKHFKVDCL